MFAFGVLCLWLLRWVCLLGWFDLVDWRFRSVSFVLFGLRVLGLVGCLFDFD